MLEENFRRNYENADFFERATPAEIRPEEMIKNKKAVNKAILGYNSFWWDIEAPFSTVRGEIRSSWIVDPPNGRVPYTAAAVAEMKKAFLLQKKKDGPEFRRLGERCLLGFGSTSGPPMLNVEYNNHYRIVQAPGYVAILVEMVHDVRIIPVGGQPLPAGMKPWMGDSLGRWEGNTLVVETRNRHPAQSYTYENEHLLYIPREAKITERFTREGPDEIFYEFTVEDPVAYRQPWRAEMALRATKGPLYEFACHEGNRSMENMLMGVRFQERQKTRKAKE